MRAGNRRKDRRPPVSGECLQATPGAPPGPILDLSVVKILLVSGCFWCNHANGQIWETSVARHFQPDDRHNITDPYADPARWAESVKKTRINDLFRTQGGLDGHVTQVQQEIRRVVSDRNVSGKMVRNLVALSLTPPLAVASLAIALRTLNDAGQVSFKAALAALAGLAVSVLMPAMVSRFMPLDGQGGLGARGLMAAGVGAATLAVGAVATGGAAAAAGASGAPGGIGPSSLGGGSSGGSGGGGSQGAMGAGRAASAVLGAHDDG